MRVRAAGLLPRARARKAATCVCLPRSSLASFHAFPCNRHPLQQLCNSRVHQENSFSENGILHLWMTPAVVALEKDNQHAKPQQAMRVRPSDGGPHISRPDSPLCRRVPPCPKA